MYGDFPTNLEMLNGRREALEADEREILDFIWQSYVQRPDGIQEKTLLKQFPASVETRHWYDRARTNFPTAWTRLTGTPPPYLVNETVWGPDYRNVKPSFLGTLLSSRGERLGGLLAKYLHWVCAQAKRDKSLTYLSGKDVAAALKLKEAEAFELARFIVLGQYAPSFDPKHTPKNWKLPLPVDLPRLLKVDDFEQEVADRAFYANVYNDVVLTERKGVLGKLLGNKVVIGGRRRLETTKASTRKAPKPKPSIVKLKAPPETQPTTPKNRAMTLSKDDLKRIQDMADDKGASHIARDFGISRRTLYGLLKTGAISAKTRRLISRVPAFAHLAQN